MLNNRKVEISWAKEEIVAKTTKPSLQTGMSIQKSSYPSRYIPAEIRKIINAEQGDKCSMPGCSKPAEVTHHELPFAMMKTHDPNNLKKLCKAHHELRHIINIKLYEIKKWAINSG
jgi:hypothetical protein